MDSPETHTPAQTTDSADGINSEPAFAAQVIVPQPTSPKERIAVLDLLRGFAVLGILAMNMQHFAMPSAAYSNPTAWGDLSGVNLAVWLVAHLFFDLKFISLFSMLFGAGILLMLQRNEKRGAARPGRLHFRRMGWLLLFGLIHAYIFWSGDILFTYAICGSIFWMFRKRKPATLLRLSVAMFAVSLLIWLFFGLSFPFWPEDARVDLITQWSPDQEEIATEIAAMRGSWLDQMPYRGKDALFLQGPVLLMFGLWRVGAMMLLGMALLSNGFLTGNWSSTRYRKVALLAGLPGMAMILYGAREHFAHGWSLEYSMFLGSQWNAVGSALLMVAYAAALVAVWKAGWLRGIMQRLEAAGRMAFSNYILQTVVCTLAFYGHGLGLFGRWERWQQALLVLCIWGLILVLSPWWIQRYGQGPLEKLWRRLTYGTLAVSTGATPPLAGQPAMGRKDD